MRGHPHDLSRLAYGHVHDVVSPAGRVDGLRPADLLEEVDEVHLALAELLAGVGERSRTVAERAGSPGRAGDVGRSGVQTEAERLERCRSAGTVCSSSLALTGLSPMRRL